jgi:hypothetical protein
MLVLDERSLYFSLTPEDDLGLVKSLKVGRSIPDLVNDVGIDIQSYVPSPASPIERIGVPRGSVATMESKAAGCDNRMN